MVGECIQLPGSRTVFDSHGYDGWIRLHGQTSAPARWSSLACSVVLR